MEEPTVRATLYRMVQSGALTTRRAGRSKFYSPTATTRAITESARLRLFGKPRRWNGKWSIVTLRFTTGDRMERERLRDVLMVEGYAALANGIYVRPRDRTARLEQFASGSGELYLFTGRPHGPGDRALVAQLWPLADVSARYARFIERFKPLRRRKLTGRNAFGARYALMFEYFRTTWKDPGLPRELLPRGWNGEQARVLAAELYRSLSPPALKFGDALVRDGAIPAR